MKVTTANLVLGFFVLVLIVLSAAAWLGAAAGRAAAYDGCRPYPITADSPTGIVGCQVYGQGIASWYSGSGVARNDCEYPWTACKPLWITSMDTGLSAEVTPTMFCDCYTGTAFERIVDLDLATLKALGLDPSRGLYVVTVWEAAGSHGGSAPSNLMPNTAMR